MEYPVLPGSTGHELIEASRSAAQHEPRIRRSEYDSLGLAGRARRVDDGDRIFIPHLRTIQRNSAKTREDVVEEQKRRRIMPCLLNTVAQKRSTAAYNCRGAVF